MPDITVTLAVSSFVAGILMFLAPCTLPLLPAYIAFISGVTESDLQTKKIHKARVLKNAFAFVFGFSVIFISFGVLAGLFGTFIGGSKVVLSQIGGVLVIVFGLSMLNVLHFFPLLHSWHMKFPESITPGKPFSAFIIGSIFALGWTPCIGPVLATVLLLASISSTVLYGALLLTLFSLGLAVPFLLIAVAFIKMSHLIQRFGHLTKWINIVGGVLMIILGVLLVTQNFGLLFQYGTAVFDFLGIAVLFGYY